MENKNKIIQNPGILEMSFTAYASPVVTPALISNYADHTYVIAQNANLVPAMVDCPCYGNPAGPEAPDSRIVSDIVNGDMHNAAAMINGSFDVYTPYDNRILDHCGIIYGLEGVCHNMANRILCIASPVTIMDMDKVNGGWLSLLIYGLFGNTVVPFIMRWFLIASNLASSFYMPKDEQSHILDKEKYNEFMESQVHRVNASSELSDELKELFRAELRDESTPEVRLTIMCKYRLKEILKHRSDVKEEDIIGALTKVLTTYTDSLDALKQTISFNDKNEIDLDALTKLIPQVNDGFKTFNAEAYKILGEGYKDFFNHEYSEDFALCNPDFNQNNV
jgi:hypothetical protein